MFRRPCHSVLLPPQCFATTVVNCYDGMFRKQLAIALWNPRWVFFEGWPVGMGGVLRGGQKLDIFWARIWRFSGLYFVFFFWALARWPKPLFDWCFGPKWGPKKAEKEAKFGPKLGQQILCPKKAQPNARATPWKTPNAATKRLHDPSGKTDPLQQSWSGGLAEGCL